MADALEGLLARLGGAADPVASLADRVPCLLLEVPGLLAHADDHLFSLAAHVLEFLSGAVAQLNAALARSEEHTSELQSRGNLVCRLLLVKKHNVIGSR